MATVSADNLKLVPLPKNTMVVARENGRMYVVDYSEFPQLDDPAVVDWDISVSKMLIGKIQLSRTQMTQIHGVECENVVHTGQLPEGATTDFKMTVFGTLDGKNLALTVDPVIHTDEDGYIRGDCRMTAKNASIQIRGTYNVNTMIVTASVAGRR